MFFNEILLAVKLATQPFLNSTLALVMSGVLLIAQTPFAFTSLTSESTSLSTISMSWIIKSNTTETSFPLGLNSANLWHSINLGSFMVLMTELIAGLNLSTWPTWPINFFFLLSFTNNSASSTLVVMGFSIKTCLFFSKQFLAISKWDGVIEQIKTASHFLTNSFKSSKKGISSGSLFLDLKLLSKQPITLKWMDSFKSFKWIEPKCPIPIIPALIIFFYSI